MAQEAILEQKPLLRQWPNLRWNIFQESYQRRRYHRQAFKRMELKFYRKKIYKIMPELPEVETIRRQLLKVVGKKIKEVELRLTKLAYFDGKRATQKFQKIWKAL